jgi:hypothetical protein
MKKIFECRRSSLGLIGIICLTAMGIHTNQDISGISVAIAGIIASIAGANSWENRSKNGK